MIPPVVIALPGGFYGSVAQLGVHSCNSAVRPSRGWPIGIALGSGEGTGHPPSRWFCKAWTWEASWIWDRPHPILCSAAAMYSPPSLLHGEMICEMPQLKSWAPSIEPSVVVDSLIVTSFDCIMFMLIVFGGCVPKKNDVPKWTSYWVPPDCKWDMLLCWPVLRDWANDQTPCIGWCS